VGPRKHPVGLLWEQIRIFLFKTAHFGVGNLSDGGAPKRHGARGYFPLPSPLDGPVLQMRAKPKAKVKLVCWVFFALSVHAAPGFTGSAAPGDGRMQSCSSTLYRQTYGGFPSSAARM